MSKISHVLTIFGIVSILLVSAVSIDSDAEVEPDKVFYCYTYDLGFRYSGGTIGNITVEWFAEGYASNGDHIEVRQLEPYPSADNGWKVKYNPEDVKKCSEIFITQKVIRNNISDSQTFKVIILTTPENGKYTINFYDGYSNKLYHVEEITPNKYVEEGDIHVSLPQPPVRDGYSFQGWYTDSKLINRFDETMPVQSDMDLYAKWASADSNDSLILILVGLAIIIVVLLVVLIVVLIRTKKHRT